MKTGSRLEVYLEVGAKRTFAGALEWPGWCRSGPGEDQALDALVAYGSRYAEALRSAGSTFEAPSGTSALSVVERLAGDATTDFGAPSIAPAADARAVDAEELHRLRSILEASWAALDRAADAAEGLPLRAGPRGGGRDLPGICAHVVGAEASYVRKIGGRPPAMDQVDRSAAGAVREVIEGAMQRAVDDGIPERGPRGGAMWSLPYFVRRAAWHVLDHAWEIEDRSVPG